MEHYKLPGSTNTPEVSLDPNTGVLDMRGVSLSENSKNFYEPILHWIEAYCSAAQAKTKVVLSIEYMDSGSFGYFNQIMEVLNDLHNSGNSEVMVHWHYERDDLDMEEYGQDLENMFQFGVELIPVEPPV